MILTKRRSTGPSPAVRQLVWERDGGCVMVGEHSTWPPHAQHHRRPRGAGGSRLADTNSPANLITLCHQHHEWVESHRSEAFILGMLVRQGHEPALTTLIYRGRMVLLTYEGQIKEYP